MDLAESLGMFELLGETEELDKTIININFGYKNNVTIDNMKLVNDLCSNTEFMIMKKTPVDKL